LDNYPLLNAIKRAATSGDIPIQGFTSGLNQVLTPPAQQKMPKVQTLEKAEKEQQKMSGGTSQRGPQATTGLNSANIVNYRPTMKGFAQ